MNFKRKYPEISKSQLKSVWKMYWNIYWICETVEIFSPFMGMWIFVPYSAFVQIVFAGNSAFNWKTSELFPK